VTFDIAFQHIDRRSSDQLYYWDGTTLTHVTDTDLGPVVDMLWIDGYTMTTDGTSIIVTELNDPTSVLPLKYGSAEEDPDMVTGLIKARDEAYALGQYTIQVFQNVGGNGFPFQPSKAPRSRSDASGPRPSASTATASRSSARRGTRQSASISPVRDRDTHQQPGDR
jgi:hypothetical protein